MKMGKGNTHGITKCVSASKGVWFVKRPDANATLYKASKIVDVALDRIDKLETRQIWAPRGNKSLGFLPLSPLPTPRRQNQGAQKDRSTTWQKRVLAVVERRREFRQRGGDHTKSFPGAKR